MKNLALLGSTGSIGRNVCAVVRQFPERFRLLSLAAGRNIELLARQVEEFAPAYVSVACESLVAPLADLLPAAYRNSIVWGEQGLCQVATLPEVNMVVSAVVGATGLQPTLAAIRAGKDIGLANKETLVMAGRLIMAEVRRQGVHLLPIDSEHSAIFQALEAGRSQDVSRLLLTASGGPFRALSAAELELVEVEAALAHPNWSMGKKISIDSATLMNKGLEVIEARWLFDMEPEKIEVVVHPQSIVHSLVEYQDGSIVAQLGIPDMRIPIAYALSYPERMSLALPRLDLTRSTLDFEEPDHARFPALQLAYSALMEGGTRPAVLNAANEVAVAAFLSGTIRFPRIAQVVSEALALCAQGDELDLEAVVAADAEARWRANQLISSFSS
ncbi:MAG: 1-deoxy-D-xylulose-5-phosphate reductoisomerase [Desulfobulbaceae bacterium]|nr:1-deoxy-D-xylulose-5-phosphate reductoisomerase [Desulfobulbaceae bacterium]